MNRKEALYIFIPLVLSMSSCMEQENNKIDNIYRTFNMNVFDGFTDKVTLNELQTRHGQPNSVIKASDAAAVDGYNVWRYKVLCGDVDCYIRKNDTIVDYLHFVPVKNMGMKDVIVDQSVLKNFISDNVGEDYFIDNFRNVIKVRQSQDLKNQFLDISLNNESQLIDDNPIENELQKLNKELPLSMGDAFSISSMEVKANTLNITCLVTEYPNYDVTKIVNYNGKFTNSFATLIFGNRGTLDYITHKIFNANLSVKINYVGSISNLRIQKDVDFKTLFNHPISNINRLKALLIFDNVSLMTSNDGNEVKFDFRKVEDYNIVLSWTILANKDKINKKILSGHFKEYVLHMLMDPEFPDKEYVLLAFKCDLGLKFIYNFPKQHKRFEAKFNEKEIENLLTKI